MMATSTTSPSQHLALFGRGVRRLVLTQPPHFRTGLLPATDPSYAERLACAVLSESRADLARHLARTGVHAPVPHLSPTKVQAKKIPAGVRAPIAGNS